MLTGSLCIAKPSLDLSGYTITSRPALQENFPTVMLDGKEPLSVFIFPLKVNRIPGIRANFESLRTLTESGGKRHTWEEINQGVFRGYRWLVENSGNDSDMVIYYIEADDGQWQLTAETTDEENLRRIDQFIAGLKLKSEPAH